MAALNANLQNFFIQWPDNATKTLIRSRRECQFLFSTTAIREQKNIWRVIANEINNDHPNFAPTETQCRTKWNSLKSGYMNMKRVINGNPDGFPVHTPTLHDEQFHEELSDEFWLIERNYLLSIDSSINSLYLY